MARFYCNIVYDGCLHAAGAPMSARPNIARQSTARSGVQTSNTGQPLPPIVQNGCDSAETNDVPPQKPRTGIIDLSIVLLAFVQYTF